MNFFFVFYLFIICVYLLNCSEVKRCFNTLGGGKRKVHFIFIGDSRSVSQLEDLSLSGTSPQSNIMKVRLKHA